MNTVYRSYINLYLLIQFLTFSTFRLGLLQYQLGSSFPVFGIFDLTQRTPGIKSQTKMVTAAMGHSKNLILVFVAIVLTAVLLRRLLGVYGLVVPVLYMFFDVNWSLRVTWIVLKKVVFSRGSNYNFLDVSESTFIVLPSDMDLNLHMNNAR